MTQNKVAREKRRKKVYRYIYHWLASADDEKNLTLADKKTLHVQVCILRNH